MRLKRWLNARVATGREGVRGSRSCCSARAAIRVFDLSCDVMVEWIAKLIVVEVLVADTAFDNSPVLVKATALTYGVPCTHVF